MTAAEQAKTRYNAILQLGADALGDFSKTSDSYANKLKLLDLEMDNLKVSIGEKILPLASDFVGMFTDLASGSKSTAESIADLTKEMSNSGGVLSLINRYRELSTEMLSTNLSKKEAAAKNAELEKTKQELITASGGVITALDLENGTFDKQVGALERATKAQQNYNQYQLESVVLENTGAEAKRKSAEAADSYATAQDRLNSAIEAAAEARSRIADGDVLVGIGSDLTWQDTLSTAEKMVDSYQKKLGDAAKTMAEVEANTAAGEEALRSLVNGGFITVEESAKKV